MHHAGELPAISLKGSKPIIKIFIDLRI